MLKIRNPKKFDWKNMDLADCLTGNVLDTYFTLKLYYHFQETLSGDLRCKVNKHIIEPCLPIFTEMEYNGLLVSEENLDGVDKGLTSKLDGLKVKVQDHNKVPEECNLGSGDQLAEVLYTNEGGFELYPPDETKGGKPSTSAPTLKLLIRQITEEIEKR